jgi:hypothetical protein
MLFSLKFSNPAINFYLSIYVLEVPSDDMVVGKSPEDLRTFVTKSFGAQAKLTERRAQQI